MVRVTAPSITPGKPIPKAMTNHSLPFLLHQTDMSGRLVQLQSVAQDIASRRDFPLAVQGLIVEAAAVAGALCSLLKFQGTLIIQARGKGPVPMIVAHADGQGGLRATAEVTRDRLDAYGKWPSFYAMLGEGYVAFTLDRGADFDRTQGVVELKSEGLAASLQHYFDQSDQVNLRLMSGARQVEGSWVAGAIALQRLPLMGGEGAADSSAAGQTFGAREGEKIGAEEAAEEQWTEALALLGTLAVEELTDPSLPSRDLLYRLFHEQGVQVAEADALERTCACDAERFIKALKTLSAEDLAEIFEDGEAESQCEFCGTTYRVTPHDLSAKI